VNDVQARARRGIKLLLGRQLVLQILMFGGGIVLARVLEPAEFGIYAITTFLVGLFSLFGEFGLAPSFIQRRDELTDRDLSVGFTLQQIVTTVVVIALFLAAPWLVSLYPKAPPETIWLVRTLAFSLYLTSWRAISALQLERDLRYERVVWVEVVENFSYQIIAVVLAVAGYGVWSFIWATMARGVLGTVLVFLIAPWRLRLGFDRKVAREILRFGVPFQLQAVINQMANWVTPTLVAMWLGPQAVGYLTWAVANGRRPLILVDNVMRVAFPHFSRIQHDRPEVERTLSHYLTYLLLAAGLWTSVMLVAGPLLVRWIYTEKWSPAIPALMLYVVVLGSDMIIWVVAMTLNSLGKVHFTTRYILVRNIAIIGLSTLLVFLMGFNGVPVGYLIVNVLSTPFVFIGLGQRAARRTLIPMMWIIIPVIVSGFIGIVFLKLSLPLIARALLTTAVICVAYVLTCWVVAPVWLKISLAEGLSNSLSKIGVGTKWLVKTRETEHVLEKSNGRF
jgi:O-antigen/teichoic acid export membrane protein